MDLEGNSFTTCTTYILTDNVSYKSQINIKLVIFAEAVTYATVCEPQGAASQGKGS